MQYCAFLLFLAVRQGELWWPELWCSPGSLATLVSVLSPRAGTSFLSWETTSQVTIPQHEEHQPSSTAEPYSSTSPPYQWLLQFSCRRLCIHKSNLWNAPIQEQCNKIHLYYWNINYVCKETVFFFPWAPQPPPPVSAELSTEQDRGDSAWRGCSQAPSQLLTPSVLFWASALRGTNSAQPMVKSWRTETSHILIKKKKQPPNYFK